MSLVLPAGARPVLPTARAAPRRAQPVAFAAFERFLLGGLHAWALRAVLHARLEARGIIDAAPADVYLYGPSRRP